MHLPQYVYSKLFQQHKFQSLCDDLLFQCRFLFALFILFAIFQTNCNINYLQFFNVLQQKCIMMINVDKCLMTQGQQFSIFWQQAGHLEIYIVSIGKFQC